jgi:hypothetical protein
MALIQKSPFIPIRLSWQNTGPLLDWCLVGEATFLAPFFDDTITHLVQRPFNQAFRPITDVTPAIELARSGQCLQPSAFILHMSRCGSTLLAQMFAASDKNLVISEGSPIDRMLGAGKKYANLGEDQQLEWIRAVVLAVGRKRVATHERYIIKLDSWSTEYIPLLEHAFPGVPWVFLYRDPLEVLVSNLQQRASAAMPGVADRILPGIDSMAAMMMPIEQYMTLVIKHICENALQQQDSPHGLFINYDQLPLLALEKILTHLKIEPNADELEQMRNKAKFSAKIPSEMFKPDAARKHLEASHAARYWSDTMLRPLHEKLQLVSARPL